MCLWCMSVPMSVIVSPLRMYSGGGGGGYYGLGVGRRYADAVSEDISLWTW